MVEFSKEDYYEAIVNGQITANTDFRVVLLDFGYAKDLNIYKDLSSLPKGNNTYAAPES